MYRTVESSSARLRPAPEPHGAPAERPATIPPPVAVVVARIVDAETSGPISGARCEIRGPGGERVGEAVSDWQGHIESEVPQEGRYEVVVLAVPPA